MEKKYLLLIMSVLSIGDSGIIAQQAVSGMRPVVGKESPSSMLRWFKSLRRHTDQDMKKARAFLHKKWRCLRRGENCTRVERAALAALAAAVTAMAAAGLKVGYDLGRKKMDDRSEAERIKQRVGAAQIEGQSAIQAEKKRQSDLRWAKNRWNNYVRDHADNNENDALLNIIMNPVDTLDLPSGLNREGLFQLYLSAGGDANKVIQDRSILARAAYDRRIGILQLILNQPDGVRFAQEAFIANLNKPGGGDLAILRALENHPDITIDFSSIDEKALRVLYRLIDVGRYPAALDVISYLISKGITVVDPESTEMRIRQLPVSEAVKDDFRKAIWPERTLKKIFRPAGQSKDRLKMLQKALQQNNYNTVARIITHTQFDVDQLETVIALLMTKKRQVSQSEKESIQAIIDMISEEIRKQKGVSLLSLPPDIVNVIEGFSVGVPEEARINLFKQDLIKAIKEKDINSLRRLVGSAYIQRDDVINAQEDNILILAVKKALGNQESLEILKSILKIPTINFNVQDNNGQTALQIAKEELEMAEEDLRESDERRRERRQGRLERVQRVVKMIEEA